MGPITGTLKRRAELLDALRPFQGEALADPDTMDRMSNLVSAHLGIGKNRVISDLMSWPTPVIPFQYKDLARMSLWWTGQKVSAGYARALPLVGDFPPKMKPVITGVEIRDWQWSGVRSRKDGSKLTDFRFRCLHGPAAGYEFWQSLHRRFMWALARLLGYKSKTPWSGLPGDFVLMWLQVELMTNADSKPSFNRYDVTSECLTHNRKVIKARGEFCPRKYPWPCAACPIGLDTCPLATHEKEREKGLCYHKAKDNMFGWPGDVHEGWYEHGTTSGDSPCIECKYGVKVDRYIPLHFDKPTLEVIKDDTA